MNTTKSTHGGKRDRAGRKPTGSLGPVLQIRIPAEAKLMISSAPNGYDRARAALVKLGADIISEKNRNSA